MDIKINVSYKDSHDTTITLTGLPEVDLKSEQYDFLEMATRLTCKRLFPRSKDHPEEISLSIAEAVETESDISSNSVEEIYKTAAKLFKQTPTFADMQAEWLASGLDEKAIKKAEAGFNAYAIKKNYLHNDAGTVAWVNNVKALLGL